MPAARNNSSTCFDSIYQRIAALDQRSLLGSDERKAKGVVYTPRAVALNMIRLVAPKPSETILEPTCGRGVFVFALVEHWREKGWSWRKIADWAQDHLFVSDIDAKAVRDTKRLFRDLFKQNDVNDAILNGCPGDALFGAYSGYSFDVVVGNPPYVRERNLEKAYRERIKTTFRTCAPSKGPKDLYYAFIEQAMRQAKRGCLITPRTWLTNRGAVSLRQALHDRVESLIDFGGAMVFKNATVTSSVIVFGKESKTLEKSPVAVRRSLNASETPIFVPRGTLNDAKGWCYDNAANHDGPTLADLVDVHAGIQTSANKAFQLPADSVVKGNVLVVRDPLQNNKTLHFPIELCPPLVRITKAGKKVALRMLCPHRPSGEVIPWSDLPKDVRSWFKARRAMLNARAGRKSGAEHWWAFSSKQGLKRFKKNDVLFFVPALAYQPLDAKRVGNPSAHFLWTSGVIVQPKRAKYVRLVKAVLKSDETWRFLSSLGKVWKGEVKPWRGISAGLLRQVPLPPAQALRLAA